MAFGCETLHPALWEKDSDTRWNLTAIEVDARIASESYWSRADPDPVALARVQYYGDSFRLVAT